MREKFAGLSSEEAKKRLNEYGPNILPENPPPSNLAILLSQLKSPLVYILIFAALISLFLGEYQDAIVISLAVFINTILGFFQERRAENALFALKKLIQPKAKVVRDGKRQVVSIEDVVPGDICIINSGDKVPADGKIVFANRLFVSEAILSGESLAVEKVEENNVFMGTVATAGEGKILVEKTGENSEMGKIAISVQKPFEDTPLRKQLVRFSKQLTVLVALLTSTVFLVGVISGKNLFEIFETSVALAVSAIPEGLLVGMTVVLAIGMQKILKRQGLVRNLVSAETLGGVTTICVDKTGTLTQGKMQVTDIVGEKIDIAKQALIANDLDDPIVTAAWEWASKKLKFEELRGGNVENYLEEHPRIDSIPFSSKNRFFASLNLVRPDKKVLFVNGAPEFLLEWSDIDNKQRSEIEEQIEKLTSRGKRVIALCKKDFPFDKDGFTEKDVSHGLSWVGMIGLADPLRDGVSEALAKTKKAGIKLVVITGDFAQTAVSVMKELDIRVDNKDVILGSELDSYSVEDLGRKLADANLRLFARTTPEQKLKIIEALKANGEVVAMMGDGVNDAPALKKADIGIVVGEASDVAKESADLVLLDSSFATIVSAIEEGRGIFENIRKIILYLMSDAFEEIVAVIATLILGLPLPVTAAQILWINLVSDGFPHLALTVDPTRKDVMNIAPRDPKEPLVTVRMKKFIVILSLWGGMTGFLLFAYFFIKSGDIRLAQSVAFATLGVNSLIYVFSVRTLNKPFWSGNPFENTWLNRAVLAGIFLQVLPFQFEATREFLGLSRLSVNMWLVILSASIVMFIIIEILKVVFRKQIIVNSV